MKPDNNQPMRNALAHIVHQGRCLEEKDTCKTDGCVNEITTEGEVYCEECLEKRKETEE